MKRVLSIAISRAAAALLAVSAVVSCMKPFEYGDGFGFIDPVEGTSDRPVRTPTDLKRNVLLLYSAGHPTGIPKYLKEDIDDLKTGWWTTLISSIVIACQTRIPTRKSILLSLQILPSRAALITIPFLQIFSRFARLKRQSFCSLRLCFVCFV